MEQERLDEISGWFAARVPGDWFTGAPTVALDGEQVVVTGALAAPSLPDGASAGFRAGYEAAQIHSFREHTRRHRIGLAREVEHRYEVPVTWAATCGATTTTFNPGGSRGSRQAEGGEDARKVMIDARRRAVRAWRKRYAFGGPPAWRRGSGSGGGSPRDIREL
ncbi:MAG: hypothetical protein M3024_08325 [Candidatus Dormibacteraeota bacterium]|nr:hypothetical protein [Candidatus Dormibacteraeota bacterium]